MSKDYAELADEIIAEIFAKTHELGDMDYVNCLEQISGALDDAASAKRGEMGEES